jgi:uncharacterized LabA/DUF88 family protein
MADTPVRVAVFIDWQNTYKAAREAFGLESLPSEHGVYSPLQIAQHMAAGNDRGDAGKLIRVEIFRGLPSQRRDKVGHSANRRHSAAWMAEDPNIVIPHLRPLRYPQDPSEPPVEKGVDVHLAISAVEWTLTDRCDVSIIFSHDTDLLPAVEAITRLKSREGVETASWVSDTHRRRLRPKPPVYHHDLDESVFIACERCINYAYRS